MPSGTTISAGQPQVPGVSTGGPDTLVGRRLWLIRLLAAGVTLLLLTIAAHLGLWILGLRNVVYEPIADSLTTEQRGILTSLLAGEPSYLQYDRELGWSIAPHAIRPGMYHANSQGFRAPRDYTFEPLPHVHRFAAFGDSFTHGEDVPDQVTWQHQLEQMTGAEVLNFGVGAYGLDQAYLRYRRDGRRFHPHVVLIDFQPENIYRTVNVYRPFYLPTAGPPLTKPRFQLRDSLALLPNPMDSLGAYRTLLADPATVLPSLGTNDWYYHTREHAGLFDGLAIVRLGKITWRAARQRTDKAISRRAYREESEAFRVTVGIFDRFRRDVLADGAIPLILILPARDDLLQGPRYQALLKLFDERGWAYIDLMRAFDGVQDVLSVAPRHYSAEGNRRVAAYLARELKARGLL